MEITHSTQKRSELQNSPEVQEVVKSNGTKVGMQVRNFSRYDK